MGSRLGLQLFFAQYIETQVLSREWRCSWSSANRRCSNYIRVINNLIAYTWASYIRDLTVMIIYIYIRLQKDYLCNYTKLPFWLFCDWRRYSCLWRENISSFAFIPFRLYKDEYRLNVVNMGGNPCRDLLELNCGIMLIVLVAWTFDLSVFYIPWKLQATSYIYIYTYIFIYMA